MEINKKMIRRLILEQMEDMLSAEDETDRTRLGVDSVDDQIDSFLIKFEKNSAPQAEFLTIWGCFKTENTSKMHSGTYFCVKAPSNPQKLPTAADHNYTFTIPIRNTVVDPIFRLPATP